VLGNGDTLLSNHDLIGEEDWEEFTDERQEKEEKERLDKGEAERVWERLEQERREEDRKRGEEDQRRREEKERRWESEEKERRQKEKERKRKEEEERKWEKEEKERRKEKEEEERRKERGEQENKTREETEKEKEGGGREGESRLEGWRKRLETWNSKTSHPILQTDLEKNIARQFTLEKLRGRILAPVLRGGGGGEGRGESGRAGGQEAEGESKGKGSTPMGEPKTTGGQNGGEGGSEEGMNVGEKKEEGKDKRHTIDLSQEEEEEEEKGTPLSLNRSLNKRDSGHKITFLPPLASPLPPLSPLSPLSLRPPSRSSLHPPSRASFNPTSGSSSSWVVDEEDTEGGWRRAESFSFASASVPDLDIRRNTVIGVTNDTNDTDDTDDRSLKGKEGTSSEKKEGSPFIISLSYIQDMRDEEAEREEREERDRQDREAREKEGMERKKREKSKEEEKKEETEDKGTGDTRHSLKRSYNVSHAPQKRQKISDGEFRTLPLSHYSPPPSKPPPLSSPPPKPIHSFSAPSSPLHSPLPSSSSSSSSSPAQPNITTALPKILGRPSLRPTYHVISGKPPRDALFGYEERTRIGEGGGQGGQGGEAVDTGRLLQAKEEAALIEEMMDDSQAQEDSPDNNLANLACWTRTRTRHAQDHDWAAMEKEKEKGREKEEEKEKKEKETEKEEEKEDAGSEKGEAKERWKDGEEGRGKEESRDKGLREVEGKKSSSISSLSSKFSVESVKSKPTRDPTNTLVTLLTNEPTTSTATGTNAAAPADTLPIVTNTVTIVTPANTGAPRKSLQLSKKGSGRPLSYSDSGIPRKDLPPPRITDFLKFRETEKTVKEKADHPQEGKEIGEIRKEGAVDPDAETEEAEEKVEEVQGGRDEGEAGSDKGSKRGDGREGGETREEALGQAKGRGLPLADSLSIDDSESNSDSDSDSEATQHFDYDEEGEEGLGGVVVGEGKEESKGEVRNFGTSEGAPVGGKLYSYRPKNQPLSAPLKILAGPATPNPAVNTPKKSKNSPAPSIQLELTLTGGGEGGSGVTTRSRYKNIHGHDMPPDDITSYAPPIGKRGFCSLASQLTEEADHHRRSPKRKRGDSEILEPKRRAIQVTLDPESSAGSGEQADPSDATTVPNPAKKLKTKNSVVSIKILKVTKTNTEKDFDKSAESADSGIPSAPQKSKSAPNVPNIPNVTAATKISDDENITTCRDSRKPPDGSMAKNSAHHVPLPPPKKKKSHPTQKGWRKSGEKGGRRETDPRGPTSPDLRPPPSLPKDAHGSSQEKNKSTKAHQISKTPKWASQSQIPSQAAKKGKPKKRSHPKSGTPNALTPTMASPPANLPSASLSKSGNVEPKSPFFTAVDEKKQQYLLHMKNRQSMARAKALKANASSSTVNNFKFSPRHFQNSTQELKDSEINRNDTNDTEK
jgi:hypothetical protein